MDILFVEDDKIIASGLEYALSQEGFNVIHVMDVKSALIEINNREFSLALLDLSLPDGDGYEICNEIKKKYDTPVIFLTAADDEGNVVKGLEMGADDYISKPFRIRELIARIKSAIRRAEKIGSKTENNDKLIINIQDIQINIMQAKVYKNLEEIILTPLEYKLLLTFAENRGKILSRNKLLECLWDFEGNFVNDNTLTVYIKRLREKLGDNSQEPKIIKTIRGLGYKVGV